MRLVIVLALALLIVSSDKVHAKRAAPAQIAPIVFRGHRIEPAFEATDNGFAIYLICTATNDGHVVWKTQLFERRYVPSMERDVQEVHLKSLARAGTKLIAVDEKGHRYEAEASTGRLIHPTSRH